MNSLVDEEENSEHGASNLTLHKAMAKVVNNSKVVQEENVQSLPSFSLDEFDIGRFLGRGGFYDVFEIHRVNLKPGIRPTAHHEIDSVVDEDMLARQEAQREYLASNCQQGMIRVPKKKGSAMPNDGYYAIKSIRKIVVMNKKKYKTAVNDSVTEVYLLASLDHPYILKIRATASMTADTPHPSTGQDAGYLIVMDRLFGTLTEKFEDWRDQSEGLCFSCGNKRAALLLKKLKLAFELSQALAYLHRINIMYRDIKQDNIGFDVRGSVKVFDFGLAKELRENQKTEDGLYKLSMAGTLRYMSPEILRGERYNMTVDVYSYGILMWEIFSLKKALEGWPYAKLLIHAKGDQAQLKRIKHVPDAINDLIDASVSFDWTKRPSFRDIVMTLQTEFRMTDEYLSKTMTIGRSIGLGRTR